jgi:formamidopyrimidine-DNA glycosylase
MPEGPEVKIIAEGIAHVLTNKTITKVSILSGRYKKKAPDGWDELQSALPLKVVGAGCHGKFIFALFENERYLWSTLGMTGSWNPHESKHARIKIETLEGDVLYYNDMRNFGTLKFVIGKNAMVKKLKSLGPDLLSQDVSTDDFKKALLAKPKDTIAQTLMNQKLICGVGNYVKAEALYHARISPHRETQSLTDDEFARLNDACKKVLRDSYDMGGSTIRSYYTFDGKQGGYSEQFCVYGRKTDPMGNDVVKEETKDKRTTHWVPKLQK